MPVKKNVFLLNSYLFFTNLNFLSPVAIIYFEKVTNSFAIASSIFSVATISSALMEIPTGILSDRIGRKATIVYGSICLLLALICFVFSSEIWLLFLGGFFQGAAQAFFSGNNDAYLFNILEAEGLEDDYHHYRGKQETIFIIGSAVAALVSGFLASNSYELIIYISFIPAIISLILSVKLTNIKSLTQRNISVFSHTRDALLELNKNKMLRMLSISTIARRVTTLAAYNFKPAVFALFWPMWAVGIARAFSELVAVPGTYTSGKIIEKFGAFKVRIICNLYAWFMNIIGPLVSNVFTPAIISSSTALWGPSEIAGNSLLQKEFSKEQRATIASINSFLSSTIFGIFAYFVGLFADHFGPVNALILIQIFVLPVLIMDWKLVKTEKG